MANRKKSIIPTIILTVTSDPDKLSESRISDHNIRSIQPSHVGDL